MREIKFRVWDKENNKFWEDFNEAYNNKIEQLLISYGGDICIRRMDGMYHESTFPGRFVLQEYTGVFDHDGKEICEGDITKVTIKGIIYICEVQYSTHRACYVFKCHTPSINHRSIDDISEESLRIFSYDYMIEVIGNAYQNPELLNS